MELLVYSSEEVRMRRGHVHRALAWLALAASAAFAQATARLSGVVTDPQGAHVPGVRLILVQEQTGQQRETTSSDTGEYVFLDVPVGVYRLEAQAEGFSKYVQSGIVLSVNRSLRNDVKLTVGALAQEVTVQADASMVEAASSELKHTVDNARMTEIPLAGRNVLALASLMPGVITTGMPDGVGNFNQTRVFINGNRFVHNNFQLDGADYTGTSYYSQPGRYPSPDAVQEFTMLTNAFSAEFGQGAAVINAATKSGGNEFRGTVWEFVRNHNLNARNFFGGPTSNKYQYNQFGFALGGPVIRNKTFFFFTYEGMRGRIGNAPTSSTVPDAALRAGNLASITRRVVDPTTGAPFPNNTIPASRLDPVAQKMLAAFVPLPNTAGSRFTIAYPTQDEFNQYLFKVDHALNSRSRLSARGVTTTSRNVSLYSPFPGFLRNTQTHPSNLTISHSHIVSPAKLNDFRATVQRIYDPRYRTPELKATAAELGFKTNPVPYTTVPPEARIAGYFNLGSRDGTIWQLENKYAVSDAFSWVRGRHVMKFGGEFKRNRFAQWGEYGTRGRFTFANDLSGSAMANYLLGLATSYSQRSPMNFSNSNYSLIGYAQDDWKITRRLTMNLGLRYEFHANPAERENKLAFWAPENFVTGRRSKVFPNAPPGLLFVGDEGMPERGGWNHYRTAGVIGPRIGLAYDVTGSGRMTIRAAYGMFNVPMDLQMVANSTQMAPFDMIVTVAYPRSYANPFEGRVDPFPTWKPKVQYDLTPLYPIEVYPNNLSYRNGYSQQWNFTVERAIGSDVKASVSYVGMHALRLWYWPKINTARYIPGVDAAGRPLSSTTNTDARRPYAPYYAEIYLFGSDATRKSNSMQLTVQKRFTGGLTIMGSYAASNTMSWWDDGHQGFPQNPNDFFANYARADTDVNHRAVMSWVYQMPKFTRSRVAGLAINGWEFSGSATFQAGFPFDVRTGVDNSLTGNGWDRPDVVGDWRISGERSKGEKIAKYFNTAAFAPNKIGQFGNLGRNALRGPGLVNIDAGLFKKFAVTERSSFQFRLEMFNSLNRANFNNPDATLTSPTYGQILSAGPARILQLGLKYLF
jgi:hypothetical protein